MKKKFLAFTLGIIMFSISMKNVYANLINNSKNNLELNIQEDKNYHSAQITFEVDKNVGEVIPQYSGTEVFYKNTIVNNNNGNKEVTTLIDNNTSINGLTISYNISKEQVKSPIKVKYLYSNSGKISSEEKIQTIEQQEQHKEPQNNSNSSTNNSENKDTTNDKPSDKNNAIISNADELKPDNNTNNIQNTNVNNTYSDINNHWGAPFINKLVSKNVIKGYPDGTFKPNNKIIRGDFFLLVNNIINKKSEDITNINFKDLDVTYYSDAIKNLASLNIISGYKDNTIKPKDFITREEVAVVLNNVLNHFNKNTEKDNNIDFSDKSQISSWAYKSIEKLSSLGIINGYNDNTIKPKNNITRAEVAKVLSNVINLLENK